MVKTIIKSNPTEKREVPEGSVFLNIAECFSETIQGEGVNTGCPATFLRLQRCTLNCIWCDTQEVWRFGNPYTIEEVLKLFEDNGVIEDLEKGHHLVLTGGSPILQQDALCELINQIHDKYLFKPFIEIENECTLMPNQQMQINVDCWNNSPKLENSGMVKKIRYKPDVLKTLADQPNSWFKFVITCQEDWNEIKQDFLDTKLISRNQIILMPEGVTRDEIGSKYEFIAELCQREDVRMSDRLHVTIWNKKTGV